MNSSSPVLNKASLSFGQASAGTPTGAAAWIASNAVVLTFALVFAAAAAVRVVNLGHDSLAHDECWRANWAHHGGLDEMRWFPPGQLAVYAVIQHVLPRTEFWIRLPDALMGILAVVLVFAVLRTRIGDWAALGAAAFVAFHSQTVFYSRVLKEFSYETVLTLLLVGVGARVVANFSRRGVAVFFGMATLGLIFGYIPILVATAWGPLVLWSAWRDRANRRRNLALVGWLSAGFVPLVAIWYAWLSGCSARVSVIYHYYECPDFAWWSARGAGSLLSWAGAQSWGVLRFVAGVSSLQGRSAIVLLACASLVAIVGAVQLWRRWPDFLKFVVILIPLAMIMGLTRNWPYGEYHMSLYLVPLFAVFFGAGLFGLRHLPIGRLLLVPPIIICLLFPASRAGEQSLLRPVEGEHLRPVFAAIKECYQPGDAVFVYYAAADATEFYWPDSPPGLLVQPRTDRGQFEQFQRRFDGLAATHRRVWLVFAHRFGDERETWVGYARSRYRPVHRFGSAETFTYCLDTQSAAESHASRASDSANGG